VSHYYLLFFYYGSKSDITHTQREMMINAVRLSFYTMMMIALHTTDNGAGINRFLRDIQQTQYIHTGVL